VRPDHLTWDEFAVRQAARETDEEPVIQPKPKRQLDRLEESMGARMTGPEFESKFVSSAPKRARSLGRSSKCLMGF
jgi:hypothetical protein